jgi:predicted transcriptional regulator
MHTQSEVLGGGTKSLCHIKKLRVNGKQFYFIMKKLMDVHLVRRIDGRYRLTSFGKVIFRVQARVEIGINYFSQFKRYLCKLNLII